jgi:hypothetical protein
MLQAGQCAADANDVALAEMDEAIAKLQLWRINRAKETCEAPFLCHPCHPCWPP